MPIDWMARAQAMRDELVACRRDLHQHPELAFQEVRTAGIVATELNKLGLEVTTGIGKTGVVGILEGQTDGPTILVRCDMDALPVLEANQTEYISQTPGKMHACGHDGHTAIGLGVAKMLGEQRDKIAGRVKFVFQPAEEIAQGAQAMIDEGLLSNPAPEVALGLHLWTDLPIGEVGVTSGPAMAAASDWELVIRGKGGHAALPEQTRDSIVAGAYLVTALQTIVSRNVGALDTAVVSTTIFQAGEVRNVIPPEARLAGTFRTYQPDTHKFVEQRFREIATGIAAALQCDAKLSIAQLTPALINDSAISARLRQVFGQLNTGLRIHDNLRWMAAEDMAVFLEKVPGVFIFVGAANAARQFNYPHHHPHFDFDEDALPIGAALLATAVADYVIR